MQLNVQNKTLISVAFEKDEKAVDIMIPDGVAKIANSFFYAVAHARSIRIPASVKEIDGGFYGKENGRDIIVWNNIEKITVDERNERYQSVGGCLVDWQEKRVLKGFGGNIVIPNGVEKIDEYAFNLCENAKEFVIPASVKEIGYMAFAGTGAKKITFLGVPEYIEIGSFVLNHELEEIVIPENEKYAFVNGCFMDKQTKTVFSATVNAHIPDGTKSIARGTFACLMMKNDILVPDSVENVEQLAFGPLFGAKVLVKKGSPAIKALKKAEVDYTEID